VTYRWHKRKGLTILRKLTRRCFCFTRSRILYSNQTRCNPKIGGTELPLAFSTMTSYTISRHEYLQKLGKLLRMDKLCSISTIYSHRRLNFNTIPQNIILGVGKYLHFLTNCWDAVCYVSVVYSIFCNKLRVLKASGVTTSINFIISRTSVPTDLRTRGWGPVFPLRKLYAEQMFVLLRTKRMQLRNHADTHRVKRFQRQKGYVIYVYRINLECWKCAKLR